MAMPYCHFKKAGISPFCVIPATTCLLAISCFVITIYHDVDIAFLVIGIPVIIGSLSEHWPGIFKNRMFLPAD